MPGIGTIVNTLAVIVGSLLGMILKKGIPEHIENALMKALGMSTMFIGVSGTLKEMLTVGENGSLSADGTMMMIVSLLIGTVIGELLRIEDRLENLGERLRKLPVFRKEGRFTEGFITSTLVICIGAMAVVGSIQDGVSHDPSMLFSKSILDGIITMVFASTLGVGVLCSAIPLALYQGLITALAGVIAGFLTDGLISNLSLVGSVLIFGVGVNLFFGKKVRVGNMLPALVVAVAYGLIF